MKNIFIGLLSLLNLRSVAQVVKETAVEESNFIIYDNIQPVYTGTYRDGKRYDGYFKAEYNEYEVTLVDYYENGILIYQYSKYFAPEYYVHEERKILNTKSIYKNGFIFTGTEYAFINKGLVCKIWKDGALENFVVHMFAMHYYNRLFFEKKDSLIRITNMLEEDSEIKYIYSNNSIISELNSAEFNMRLGDYKNIDVLHVPASSLIFYIKLGNEMLCKSHKMNKDADDERQQFHVNTQLYGNLKLPQSGTVVEAFLYLATYFSKQGALDKIFYADELPAGEQEEVPEEYILALMDTDSSGKIRNGIRWVDTAIPFYEEYKDGQLIKKEHIDIHNFQTVATNFYETLMAVNGE